MECPNCWWDTALTLAFLRNSRFVLRSISVRLRVCRPFSQRPPTPSRMKTNKLIINDPIQVRCYGIFHRELNKHTHIASLSRSFPASNVAFPGVKPKSFETAFFLSTTNAGRSYGSVHRCAVLVINRRQKRHAVRPWYGLWNTVASSFTFVEPFSRIGLRHVTPHRATTATLALF